MKILFTSDIHVDPRYLGAACNIALKQAVDCLIIGGDLIPHFPPMPSPERLLEIQIDYLKTDLVPRLKVFRQTTKCAIYLDLGNDDLRGARKILEAHDGELFHLLHGRKHCLTPRVDIVGYMNVPPTPFVRKDWEKPDTHETPYEPGNRILVNGYISRNGRIETKQLDLNDTDTIESDLDRLSEMIEKPFVFVSHSPPHNTPLDILSSACMSAAVPSGILSKAGLKKGFFRFRCTAISMNLRFAPVRFKPVSDNPCV
ncbi:MAG: metallophosphoesterase [Desulfobacterales bacterium]|nr:metallophosphoesterase [Desulfobacterales bacterium]